MLDKFWESLGENLAGEWLKHVFSPAFLFWIGGLGIYVLSQGWLYSWNSLIAMQPVEQIGFLIAALIILILSSLIMKNLRFTILRLLEGYWPWPFNRLASALADLQMMLLERNEKQWNDLKGKEDSLNRQQHRKLSNLEMRLHYFPVLSRDLQPTMLGNILRMAETTQLRKYGLDAVVCWPRLWILLPEDTRKELSASREVLMSNVELWAWGLLFLFWSNWSPWSYVITVLWLFLSSTWLRQSAMVYSELLEAAFDLYRWKLYENVRWDTPEKSGREEVEMGQRLTEFLWRGETDQPVEYKRVKQYE